MKFIKGFLVSIAIYIGLSVLFYGLFVMYGGSTFVSIFSDVNNISKILYTFIASPTFVTATNSSLSLLNPPSPAHMYYGFYVQNWSIILGSFVPIAAAALLGSLVERKSGSTKYIFLSTFIGLLVIAFIGILMQVLVFPDAGLPLGTDLYLKWEWFLSASLIMTAINAFVWCAIGLFITNKGWG